MSLVKLEPDTEKFCAALGPSPTSYVKPVSEVGVAAIIGVVGCSRLISTLFCANS